MLENFVKSSAKKIVRALSVKTVDKHLCVGMVTHGGYVTSGTNYSLKFSNFVLLRNFVNK